MTTNPLGRQKGLARQMFTHLLRKGVTLALFLPGIVVNGKDRDADLTRLRGPDRPRVVEC